MADDYKVQISGDIGNAMIVLRGDTVAEVAAQAAALAESVDEIYDNLNLVKQVTLLKEAFSERKGFGKGGNGGNGSGYAGGAGSSSGGAARPATATPDGGHTCKHGAMKAFDFKNSEGKQVSGFNCPLPKGTDGRCKAVMNR